LATQWHAICKLRFDDKWKLQQEYSHASCIGKLSRIKDKIKRNYGTLLKLNTMSSSHTFLKHLFNVSTKTVHKTKVSRVINLFVEVRQKVFHSFMTAGEKQGLAQREP
jgi:hypothetical protein